MTAATDLWITLAYALAGTRWLYRAGMRMSDPSSDQRMVESPVTERARWLQPISLNPCQPSAECGGIHFFCTEPPYICQCGLLVGRGDDRMRLATVADLLAELDRRAEAGL